MRILALLLPALLCLALGLRDLGAEAEVRAPEEVVIPTADGLAVAGTYWASSLPDGPAVVLLHMYGSERTAWAPLVQPLLDRRLAVLAIDLRGHGASRVQHGVDLGPMVAERDARLFASMHDDARAALRWLAEGSEEEGRPARGRVALVGASVGCSVALHTAALGGDGIAAVLLLSPGRQYLGLESLVHARELPPALPLALVAHKDEAEGAEELADVVQSARHEAGLPPRFDLRILDDEHPPGTGRDRSFFHGTHTFGRVPAIEAWVAGWLARELGTVPGDALIDGLVGAELADGGAWAEAARVPSPPGADLRAYRVGRRLVIGGRIPADSERLDLFVEARGAEGLLALLRVGTMAPPDALLVGGPAAPGVVLEGAFLPADLPWPEPPARLVFVRHETGITFEGEVDLPIGDAAVPSLRLAWGHATGKATLRAEGVDDKDASTWLEVPAR